MTEFRDPQLVAIPFYFALMWWEYRVLTRRRANGEDLLGFTTPDTRASLLMGTVSVVTVGVLHFGSAAVMDWLWSFHLLDLGTGVLAWVIAAFAWDFTFYWAHRWEHEIRFGWAAHVNHHSSEFYNLSTALRQEWTPLVSTVLFTLLVLVGIRPQIVLITGGFNLIYQFWIHTEAISKLPAWFEFVFNTPSHHRVHHGSNPQYLDKNYGGILIVWDRLFGTFEPEGERVRYGITKNIKTYNLWQIFSHEYTSMFRDARNAVGLKAKWMALFGPPGWVEANAVAAPSYQSVGR
jgi:sterol desaturase/sphingolipid hydroxylase (fatty acid hydroxylase superfamily)